MKELLKFVPQVPIPVLPQILVLNPLAKHTVKVFMQHWVNFFMIHCLQILIFCRTHAFHGKYWISWWKWGLSVKIIFKILILKEKGNHGVTFLSILIWEFSLCMYHLRMVTHFLLLTCLFVCLLNRKSFLSLFCLGKWNLWLLYSSYETF